jgi:hypothetical protein
MGMKGDRELSGRTAEVAHLRRLQSENLEDWNEYEEAIDVELGRIEEIKFMQSVERDVDSLPATDGTPS